MDKIRPNSLAIIKKNGKVLAIKAEDKVKGDKFYRLIGGGVEFGELSLGTLKREIREELDSTTVNEKFICPIENVFEYNGEKYHEITFLYECDLLEETIYNQEVVKILDKDDSFAEWVDIEKVKNSEVILYPLETVNYL
jgi:ADP-ribose pyrophosphatase YjhB (NUDIX family)